MTRFRWMILLAGVIITLFLLKAFGFTVVEMKGAAFSYRPEVEAYATLEDVTLKNQNGGYINASQELAAYDKIYKATDGTDMDLTSWSTNGGAAPKVFRVRVNLRNYGNEASPETPINIKLYAKVGEYFVDQQAFMVDQQNLQKSAQWVQFETLNGAIPNLANNEKFDYYSDPIAFGHYLLTLEHKRPVAIKAVVSIPGTAQQKTIEIPVNADHFALDDLRR